MASPADMGYDGMTFDQIQAHGRQHYRKKNYGAALEAFNAAMKISSEKKYDVLDNRAATYEKLVDWKAALRDAKAMIKEDKTVAKGHLRAGKILLMMGNPTKALDIYQYGLRHTVASDPSLELLKRVQCDLERRINNIDVRQDPVACFPYELLQEIFGQLSSVEKTRCLRVSRSWRGYLSSMAGLWRELVICTRRKQRPLRRSVELYIQRGQKRLERATLDMLPSEGLACINLIGSMCPFLEYLEIRHSVEIDQLCEVLDKTAQLKTLILSQNCLLSVDDIAPIVMRSSSLRRLECTNIRGGGPQCGHFPIDSPTNLEHLELRSNDPFRHYLDIDAPYLRHVALVPYWELYDTCGRSLQRFPSLEHVELDRSLLCHLPFLPATVRSISVNGCDSYFRNTPPFNPHEPVPHVPAEFDLPNLESIEACGTTIIPPIMLGLMLSSAKTKMRRVLLNASGGDYQPPLVEASRNGYLTNLTMLGLAGQSMTDDGVVAIAQGAPNLEHVNLSSTAVSGISVKALLERPDSKIKLLSVDNCSYLNPDAVEYARAKGVHVNFSFPDPKRRATKPTGHIYVV